MKKTDNQKIADLKKELSEEFGKPNKFINDEPTVEEISAIADKMLKLCGLLLKAEHEASK